MILVERLVARSNAGGSVADGGENDDDDAVKRSGNAFEESEEAYAESGNVYEKTKTCPSIRISL